MTDKEIIKALECCGKNPPMCSECGYKGRCNRIDCYDYLKRDALNLINRQKAKNEMLETNCLSMAQTMPNMAKAERAEAVKEFAERLKEKAWIGMWETIAHVDIDDIDNLVKEMVGAESG